MRIPMTKHAWVAGPLMRGKTLNSIGLYSHAALARRDVAAGTLGGDRHIVK
jgi:hypothetical protein